MELQVCPDEFLSIRLYYSINTWVHFVECVCMHWLLFYEKVEFLIKTRTTYDHAASGWQKLSLMRRTEVTASVKNLGISRVKSWESRMRIRKNLRVENENERSQNKIENWDREWDESFPWESQFWDRDESLAEVCTQGLIEVFQPLNKEKDIKKAHKIAF